MSAEELKTEKVKLILLSERNRLNSPYSARNRGVEKATGDILIFVDANSIPEAGWLREGVRCMIQSGADLVAGHVNFILDRKSTRLNSSHVAISYAVFCVKKKIR